MSEHSISIVPRQSTYTDRQNKANEILDWLVSRDIVKPTLSDCVGSSNNGYTISNGAKNVSDDPDTLPFDYSVNGLDIITTRQIFDTGENGIEELICPNCNQDISSEDWDFFNDWSESISNNLTCPLCDDSNDIHNFKFTPQWGFSDLGFTFWNWPPLTDSFVAEFKDKLKCDVDLVLTWL